MKTLKSYVNSLAYEDLAYNKEIVNEGWLGDLIKGGISLYAKLYKFADSKYKDLLAKNSKKKELQELQSCKTRKWWDNYFKGTDWEKKWFEINPLDKKEAKESLNNTIKPFYEAEMVDGIGKGTTANKDANPTTLEEMFTAEKFEQYSKVSGMTELIIAGFGMMYDLGKTNNDKQVMTIASTFMKNALKMPDKSVSPENKEKLKKSIKALEESTEEKKEEESSNKNGQPSEKEVQDTNKKVESTSKALGGNISKVKKALKDIVPLDKTDAQQNESLNEAKVELPAELQSFKDDFILSTHKAKDGKTHGVKDPKIRSINKQAVIQIVSSISSALENIKDNSGKPIDKDILFSFLSGLMNYDNFKKFI